MQRGGRVSYGSYVLPEAQKTSSKVQESTGQDRPGRKAWRLELVPDAKALQVRAGLFDDGQRRRSRGDRGWRRWDAVAPHALLGYRPQTVPCLEQRDSKRALVDVWDVKE